MNDEPDKAVLEDAKTASQGSGNRGAGWMTQVITTTLLSVAVSVGVVAAYDRYFATRIMGVDVMEFMNEQKELYAGGKLTAEQFKTNMRGFQDTINLVPNRIVLLSGDIVLRNAEILAPEIKGDRQDIDERGQGGSRRR